MARPMVAGARRAAAPRREKRPRTARIAASQACWSGSGHSFRGRQRRRGSILRAIVPPSSPAIFASFGKLVGADQAPRLSPVLLERLVEGARGRLRFQPAVAGDRGLDRGMAEGAPHDLVLARVAV